MQTQLVEPVLVYGCGKVALTSQTHFVYGILGQTPKLPCSTPRRDSLEGQPRPNDSSEIMHPPTNPVLSLGTYYAARMMRLGFLVGLHSVRGCAMYLQGTTRLRTLA